LDRRRSRCGTIRRRTTPALIIGGTHLRVKEESLEDLYELLRAEFGWDEVVLTERNKKQVTTETKLEGGEFYVWEFKERRKGVGTTFPGETHLETAFGGTGAEIQEWINAEVGVKCQLAIVARSNVPRYEEF
jgi:hypothetical protein